MAKALVVPPPSNFPLASLTDHAVPAAISPLPAFLTVNCNWPFTHAPLADRLDLPQVAVYVGVAVPVTVVVAVVVGVSVWVGVGVCVGVPVVVGVSVGVEPWHVVVVVVAYVPYTFSVTLPGPVAVAVSVWDACAPS